MSDKPERYQEPPDDEEPLEADKAEQTEQRTPLSQTLGFGAGTFLAAGMVDLLAHLGPTGLVVGGIAAYVASRHGPQLYEQVREALPSPPAREASRQPVARSPRRQQQYGQPERRGRSVLDRALGRFPEEDVEDVSCEQEDDTVLVDEEDEWETALVEEAAGEAEEALATPRRPPSPATHALHLAPRLDLSINEVIDAGVFVSGMKGSGKSSLAARLMEQVGRFPIPQIIYDLKGDFVSLALSSPPHLQAGLVMTAREGYTAETILGCGLQVVVDLRTWPDMEHRAAVMARLNSELLKYAMSVPEDDRFPWFVHVDEAQQFVSQQKPVGISVPTWKWATASVTNLGVLGRACGAVLCLYTQRIADIHKDTISQQELRIFMKVALHNDLQCYKEYVNAETATRQMITGFRPGDAVVMLPDGRQVVTRFWPRQSRHASHTPHLTQALQHRALLGRPDAPAVPLMPAPSAHWEQGHPRIAHPGAASVPSADASIRRVTTPPQARQPAEQDLLEVEPVQYQQQPHASQPLAAMRPVKARLTPELEQALAAYQEGATTARGLADALKKQGMQCEKDKAASLMRRLRELGAIP